MKKQILSVVAMSTLVVTLMITGYANYAGLGSQVTADIPFAFQVGGKTLPAGKYAITRGTTGTTLMIRNIETKQAMGFIIHDEYAKKVQSNAQLNFRRYGRQYFLAQVWDGNSDTMQELQKSRAERAAAKPKSDHLAQAEIVPEIVSVSASVN